MRTAQTDNAGNRLDRRELAAFVDDNTIDVIFQQSVQYFLMCNGKVAAAGCDHTAGWDPFAHCV